jgi:hypothetical protein
MENVGILYDSLKFFRPFGIFWGHLVRTYFPLLVCFTKKNLATLHNAVCDYVQCDQTFCGKKRPIVSKYRPNGALVNKNCCPEKLVVKILQFKYKK